MPGAVSNSRCHTVGVALCDALIFDLDGTLADSLADIGGAMNEALAARGLPLHPLQDFRHMVGEGVETLGRRALPPGREAELAPLLEAYRAAYRARMTRETKPYPGIAELLEALKARRVPMAVLSNKRDDFTVGLVERLFGPGAFVEVRGEREGTPRKPDPTAALALAGVLGVEPARVGFVGDTPIDVRTALAAGMVPIAVTWGFRDEAEVRAAGARFVLGGPAALLPLVADRSGT